MHHYFGGRKQVYIALLERLGTLAQALGDGHPQEWQSACPDGRGATAGGQEYRVARMRIDLDLVPRR